GLAAFALAALVIVFAESFRGERVPLVAEGDEVRPGARGFAAGVSSLERSWRDYVALTKPRIMSLLLVTGFCGMIAGARGWPGTGLAVAATGGPAPARGGGLGAEPRLSRA